MGFNMDQVHMAFKWGNKTAQASDSPNLDTSDEINAHFNTSKENIVLLYIFLSPLSFIFII